MVSAYHPAGRTDPGRQPAALPGFERINRYWDPTNKVYAAKLLPGEYYVTEGGEMITTVLGSCISACIRDSASGVGGMNHFMLPHHVVGASAAWEVTEVNAGTRYGNFAMEHLINDILKRGGDRRNLEVKVFGGGGVLQLKFDVAARNIEFVTNYLRAEGLSMAASDVGGVMPRKVNYDPSTGRVRVKKLRPLHNDTIVKRERKYLDDLEHKPQKMEIDLF